MASTVTVPDHIPGELVVDIGHMFSPEFLTDPYEFYAGIHDRCPPIFYNPGFYTGNTWVTIKHATALHALRNSEHFQSGTVGAFPREETNWYDMIPQEIDPPQHRKYRNIIDPMLSPVAVKQLAEDIRALANELIDDVIEKGECEFTEDFARPLPVSVFLKFMGLPLDKRDIFVRWVVQLIQALGGPEAVPVMGEIGAYLSSVIAEKREKPDDGAISRIVHGEIDGRPLGEREVFGFTFFLFIAGIDTVYAAMNNIWVWLARNPARRHEMIASPDKIDAQLEELLRVYGVTFSGRELTADIELDGVAMKRGDRLFCLLPACNYDPDVFPNPREVNFERPRKPILTFTGGVHACMGAHLARLEMKIALQEWLRRIPDFQIKPGAEITYSPSGVIGPDAVPLVW
jgi:cytochrome P450